MSGLLAQPYGYPSLMSSYAFDRGAVGRGAGPAVDDQRRHQRRDVCCQLRHRRDREWVCEHRDPFIGAHGRLPTRGRRRRHQPWWSNGANAIAFSRRQGLRRDEPRERAVTAPSPPGLAAGSTATCSPCDARARLRRTSVTVDAAGAVR